MSGKTPSGRPHVPHVLDNAVGAALALASSLLLGCPGVEDDTAAPASIDSDAALTLSSASWGLAWDLGRVEAAGDGWVGKTDTGYRFELESGFLVDYAVQLVACDNAVMASRGGDRWLGLLGIGVAHAHHGEVQDTSLIEPVEVEVVGAPDRALAWSRFTPGEYCGLHWLVARGDPETRTDDGASAWGTSLKLTGRWWGVDGVAGDIALSTSLNRPMLRGFDDCALRGNGEHATVTLTRDLGGLFDGVDFEQDGPSAIEWAVLGNLVDQGSCDVALGSPSRG